jgi:hypothetical protein
MIAQAVRGRDAEARLIRALTRHAAGAGVTLCVETRHTRPWCSATYEGVQLHLTLSAAPAPVARVWLGGLAEAELPMRDHVAMPPALDSIREEGDCLVAEAAMLVLVDG